MNERVAAHLVVHAINSLPEPNKPCCSSCCAPCNALVDLIASAEIEDIVRYYVEHTPEPPVWWVRDRMKTSFILDRITLSCEKCDTSWQDS